ncbi:prepilin peptidase [Amycolatopsis acididurans]
MVAWCWACATSCVLTITDVRSRRLPFPIVAVMAAGGLGCLTMAAAAENRWTHVGFACVAAVGVFAAAAAVQVVAPEYTGGGDTALYGAVALYLGWFGWHGLVTGLLLATGLTAVVAILIAVVTRRARARFPAGPSVLAGALLGMLIA